MPNYHVVLSKRASKFLDNLNPKTRRLVIYDLINLTDYPKLEKSLDLARLKGQKGYFRLRTGKIRTIFMIDDKTKTILIRKISYREAAYE